MIKCLDSYALIEITEGNPKFAKLLDEQVAIPDVIMAEFYGYLYRNHNLQTANYWYRKLRPLCRSTPQQVHIHAAKYRVDFKSQKLSFFDCVGYLYAQEHNMLFVTGDKEFKNKKGVEYIK